MCVAALTISADLLGAIGAGTGILMAVTIIYDMYERLEKEGESMGLTCRRTGVSEQVLSRNRDPFIFLRLSCSPAQSMPDVTGDECCWLSWQLDAPPRQFR